MPGAGRAADPLWSGVGFAIGFLPGIYFHQIGLGTALGVVLAAALGLIAKDRKNSRRRP